MNEIVLEWTKHISWGTVTLLELAWTLVALYGIPVTFSNWQRARGRIETVEDGGDVFSEVDTITVAVASTLHKMVFLAMVNLAMIGAVGMTRPNYTGTDTIWLSTLLYSMVFMIIKIVMIRASIRVSRDERRIRRIISREALKVERMNGFTVAAHKDIKADDEVFHRPVGEQ